MNNFKYRISDLLEPDENEPVCKKCGSILEITDSYLRTIFFKCTSCNEVIWKINDNESK